MKKKVTAEGLRGKQKRIPKVAGNSWQMIESKLGPNQFHAIEITADGHVRVVRNGVEVYSGKGFATAAKIYNVRVRQGDAPWR